MRKVKLKFGLLASTMIGSTLPTIGHAQEAVDQEGAETPVIIVTAQKREQNLQDVPLAITAIDETRLERSGVTAPDRIQFAAPNVNFAQAGSDTRVAIRGISTNGIELNADPVVGFFVDGVYQSRTAQALAGFVDLARVEVVRGPQGTLYGRNTTGGSINIISNEPTDVFEGQATFLYGNFDHMRITGHVNIPLGDAVALRVAGLWEQRDPYAVNLFYNDDNIGANDEDQIFLRGSLKFDLGPDTEILLRGNLWRQDGQGGGFNTYKIAGQQLDFDGDFVNVNPFTSPVFSQTGSDPGGNPTDPYEFSQDVITQRDIDQEQISLTFSHDFGGVAFTSITAYNHFDRFTFSDSDLSELDQFDVPLTQGAETITQEIQLASSGDGPVDWIVGGYFLDDENEERLTINILPDSTLGFLGPLLADRDGVQNTTSYAFFGQVGVEVTPGLTLTGGARWTRDEKAIDITNVFGFALQDEIDFERVTWRAAVDYEASPDMMIYAYAATGFKSGGFNLNGTPAYDPETVITYEAGVKQTIPGGFLNVAAFYSDFDDLQVNSFDPVTITSFIRNAASATVKGIEAEVQWSPDGMLVVNGSFALQNAEYGDLLVADQFGGAPAAIGPDGTPLPGITNLNGRTLPRAPNISANISVSNEFDAGSAGTFRPLVQLSYFGESYLTEFSQPLDRQKPYAKIDLRLFWESENESIFGEVFVQNLTDEAVLISGVYGPGQGLFANYAAPRTYGARIGFRF